MNRTDILDKAKEAVALRPTQYGTPENNFERIAKLWTVHLRNSAVQCTCDDFEFEPSDVALMLAMVKIARLEQDPTHPDSWIDLAGYAACGAEVSPPLVPQHPETAALNDALYGDDRPSMTTGYMKPLAPERATDDACEHCEPAPILLRPMSLGELLRHFQPQPSAALSEFGFGLGETVNTTASAPGEQPGLVAGFDIDSGMVLVHWRITDKVVTSQHHYPENLRHGV